jgi:hypothetical protein
MLVDLDEHLRSIDGAPMADVLHEIGITKKGLAVKLKEALDAKIRKPLKLKGWFDKRKKLPDGYSIIKGTAEETLIELCDADWSIREGARKDTQKLLGLYPAETFKVKHGFDDIIGEVIVKGL